MGLSAALYSGTSGLKAHGEAMTVIGNNVANVSTVGFKGASMQFEDALSQSITTASGSGQVGRGVAVGTVMADMSQGSFETTNESTDLSIGGSGFFIVSPQGEEREYYTRAGNFRFDQDGYLVDPHGYVLQGWEVQEDDGSSLADSDSTNPDSSVKTSGVPQDIRLDNFQSSPEATTSVNMVANLDSSSENKSRSDTDPFFAMFNNWDSAESDPIGDTMYAYQSTIKVYDENGSSHNMTIYFDPVKEDSVVSAADGSQYWEYMVTVPPSEDNREFWGSTGADSKKGVMMVGTIKFNSAGDLENMSAFTLKERANMTTNPPSTTSPANPDYLSSWVPADFSQDGYPICTPNFTGAADASSTSYYNTASSPWVDETDALEADPKNIQINFGIRNNQATSGLADEDQKGWTSENGTVDSADDFNVSGGVITSTGFTGKSISALSSTSYNSGSTTLYQSQDGYPAGFLESVSVSRDGVLTASYSNGQVKELFALTIADFNNEYGLYREGGNLFSETQSSGSSLTGLAGTGSRGTIASNSLEMSNVDLATEFVKMITIEKGFQANSKTITTTDTMLSTLINIKR